MTALEGKTCLLTGATGGIGAATARILAGEGMSLFLTATGKGALGRLARELHGPMPHAVAGTRPADFMAPGEVAVLCEEVVERIGTPDAVVFCSGIGGFGLLAELTPEDLTRQLQVNLVAPFLILKRLAPAMAERGSGSVVAVSSITGLHGYPQTSAYAASKAGLIGMCRSLREELMPRGVRVFTVCPSSVDTSFVDNIPKHLPREKMIRPADVARVILRLLAHPENVVEEEVVLRPMAMKLRS